MITLSKQLILSLLLLSAFLQYGCSPKKGSAYSNKFYLDFDPFNRTGINEITEEQKEKIKNHNGVFYELMSRDNKPDTLFINGPLELSGPMKLGITHNSTISLFETSYPYYGGNYRNKIYFVFTKDVAAQYTLYDDYESWYVTLITRDSCYGGFRIIHLSEMVNLRSKLLKNEPIISMQMPDHFIHKHSARLNNKFTFNTWINGIHEFDKDSL